MAKVRFFIDIDDDRGDDVGIDMELDIIPRVGEIVHMNYDLEAEFAEKAEKNEWFNQIRSKLTGKIDICEYVFVKNVFHDYNANLIRIELSNEMD